jgi:hypothetical protein
MDPTIFASEENKKDATARENITFRSCFLVIFKNSGAIHKRVPFIPLMEHVPRVLICLLKPKSDNFILPAMEIKMFSGLMSRWISLFEWM